MKKYRLYAAVALLGGSSILVSGPGFSTSGLPDIDATARPFQQQNCPVEGGFGCFNGPQQVPFAFCRQFMQMFLRPGAS